MLFVQELRLSTFSAKITGKCMVRLPVSIINQNIIYMTREMQKELEEKYFRECGDRAVAEEMAQMDYDADQASSDYYPHYDECSGEYWF